MNVRSKLKSTARSAVRPLWLIVWRRLEVRIRAMELVAQHTESVWQQHVPAFLNAVSTIGAFGHELLAYRKASEAGLAALARQMEPLNTQVAALRDEIDTLATLRGQFDDLDRVQRIADVRLSEIAARVEFVQRELRLQMKAGAAGAPAPQQPSSLQPWVVSTDKLTASVQTGVRLNLGCGHVPVDGYLNVDTRALPGVDIIAEVGNVPFQAGTVREVHSVHLLEHFTEEELRQRLLPYWLSLLEPGGTFSAVVPDGEAMLAHFAAGDYPFSDLREALFGAQDCSGGLRVNMFVPQSLKALLVEVGFVDPKVPVKGRRNGACYEFEINARRP